MMMVPSDTSAKNNRAAAKDDVIKTLESVEIYQILLMTQDHRASRLAQRENWVRIRVRAHSIADKRLITGADSWRLRMSVPVLGMQRTQRGLQEWVRFQIQIH